MSAASIRAATSSDLDLVVATLVTAFCADPLVRWVFPEPHQYLTNFPKVVRLHWGRAFPHGSAYCTDDAQGAALWFPPGVQADPALGEVIQTAVVQADQEKVFGLLEQMSAYQPSQPHWYLRLIGVDPMQQGRGYGSALLRHALIRCDRENKPAYLESSSNRNLPLYERHGFQVLGKIHVGDSPTIYPMLRPAG